MTTPSLEKQASFSLKAHNPDVLTCIANLSNDEVFTPPELAGQMLDTVAEAWAEGHEGASIWQNPDVTFLDPFTKSGVFLREITRRLTEGLTEVIPDLQERVDHILTKQVYGIGITQLTSLLARRSVYCSKDAMGAHSVAKSFDREWGNIWFERTEHTWAGDKCAYCGAGKSGYGRGDELETHAYAFIHTKNPRALLARMFGADVQFDVIIGNPPYQLSDDVGSESATRIASASPIYHDFVEQAKRLEPRYLSMIIPSRWMAGGRGLSKFREIMLADKGLSHLVDYPAASDVFGPGVRVSGGVCYFLREADRQGTTRVTTIRGQSASGPVDRVLDAHDVFIRDVEAVEVLQRVLDRNERTVSGLFKPGFGLDTNFSDYHDGQSSGDLVLHLNIGGMGHQRATRFLDPAKLARGHDLVDTWKVLVPAAAGYGAEQLFDRVLGQPIVAGPGEVGTQTYRVVGPFSSESEAQSFVSYYSTTFFRFLVSLRKVTQHASPAVYSWVPLQVWDRRWTDAELMREYGLSEEERQYVSTRIREVDWAGEAGNG